MQGTTLITVECTFIVLVMPGTQGKEVFSFFNTLTINFLAVLLKKTLFLTL